MPWIDPMELQDNNEL